jgi:hypothetical protein
MHIKLSVKLAPAAISACLQLTFVLSGNYMALAEAAKPADAKAPEPPKKKKWESVASVDLTLTRGNSRTFLATASVNTQRKWASDELLLGGSAGYGNSTVKSSSGQETSSETQDYLKGFGQFNHLFSERFYSGLRLEGLHDNVADINYRITVSPMAGYYFIKHTNTFLSGEVGPSLIDEELGHHTQTYLGLRVGERFEHKFGSGAKIWQSLEWIPQVDKFDNWILNAEAGVAAPITKSLDVRLIAQDTYNNQPAAGRLKNDLKLLAGIGYRF